MFCTNCGFKQELTAKFCVECGAKILASNGEELPPSPMQLPLQKETKIRKSVVAIIAILVMLIGGLIFGVLFAFNIGIFGLEKEYKEYNESENIIRERPECRQRTQAPDYIQVKNGEQPNELIDDDEILPEQEVVELPLVDSESIATSEWLDLEIMSVEESGGGREVTFIHFRVTNRHEHNIIFGRSDILLNGEEIRMPLFRLNAPAGTTVERRVDVRDYALNPGDILTFSSFLSLSQPLERGTRVLGDLGVVDFTFTIEEVSKPGSNVTNPEHIRKYEDVTIMITHVDFGRGNTRDEFSAEIEFLLLNSTEYVIVFDPRDVYINDLPIDDGWMFIFFRADPGSEFRASLILDSTNLNDTIINYGDTITLSGRLTAMNGTRNVVQEKIAFTFVI